MKKSYKTDSNGNVKWLQKEGDLSGAPEIVEGNFNCSFCNLDSLEGGPREVKGSYFCCYNNKNLNSLKGAAEVVGGNFDCSGCNLFSLEGGPEEVEGSYFCNDNESLKSLKGICRATDYGLPDGFTLPDIEKELKRQKIFKGIEDNQVNLLDVLF